MNNNMLYGMIIISQPNVRYMNAALAFIATVAPFFVAWYLGISLWGLALGMLVATGLGVFVGLGAGALAVKLFNFDWLLGNIDKVQLAAGYVSILLGCGLFIGFTAAFLVFTVPMLVTVPASYGLRRWAIRKYQDSTLWDSLN